MSKLQNNNTYCIYKHTSPSGKCYIGQTNNYHRRSLRHKSARNLCVAFSLAIKKYGWDNFTHEILQDNLTIDEANNMENFYIETLNSLSPNGYNLKVGGDNKRVSDETKERMSKSFTGRFVSDECREKMRLTSLNMSDETKNKIRIKSIGRRHSDISKEKIGSAKRKIWHITDPDGSEITIDNLRLFCEENKLNYYSMRVVLSNGNYFKGYKLSSINNPPIAGASSRKIWTIKRSDNEVFVVDNLKEFCIKNNLNYNSMINNIKKRGFYKEYVLLGLDHINDLARIESKGLVKS